MSYPSKPGNKIRFFEAQSSDGKWPITEAMEGEGDEFEAGARKILLDGSKGRSLDGKRVGKNITKGEPVHEFREKAPSPGIRAYAIQHRIDKESSDEQYLITRLTWKCTSKNQENEVIKSASKDGSKAVNGDKDGKTRYRPLN